MSRIQFSHRYEDIISLDNLLEAWSEFVRSKRSRADVFWFGRNLMGNIIALRQNLVAKTYRHSAYEAFKINDPKPRDIHKAKVRDRLLHHALYRQLYPFFDRTFIADSFSCRRGKGTHKALKRFQQFSRQVSKNNTKQVWVLKCDVRKFFASIDHDILLTILAQYIPNEDILNLLKKVVDSFHSTRPEVGLPLGNLTSQLLVNIYMNEFDQFAKHKLKARHYIRYADDFVILSQDKNWLEEILPIIDEFLQLKLGLKLHPNKVSIKTIGSGMDFLGWVHFPNHRVLRTATKKRMWRKLEKLENDFNVLNSYLGLLSHGNARKLQISLNPKLRQPWKV